MAHSAHPPGCFKGFKSQAMRIRRNCTTLTDYRLHIEPIIKAYEERGYQRLKLGWVAREVELSDREAFLTVKKRNTTHNQTPVCVLPYNQHNINARTIILKYWHFLKNSLSVGHLFQNSARILARCSARVKSDTPSI